MILTSDTPINRLGIFFFYDAQGVVDDYVPVSYTHLRAHETD